MITEDRAERLRAAFASAALRREPAYIWTDDEGDRWKVTPDGVWRWHAASGRYHLSGWPSAATRQLLRLAGIA